jgi:hypothetical protein
MMARRNGDTYYTPDPLACALVDRLPIAPEQYVSILEPHAGSGAFCRAIVDRFPLLDLEARDVDPLAPALAPGQTWRVGACDFLSSEWVARPDWIVGNPPYSNAEEHVRKALETSTVGVAFLLRQGFLSSQKRRALWEEWPPRSVHVLSERPSFTGGGTDSSDYAWIVWDRRVFGPPSLHWVSWREGGRRAA